jgi:hypothetical protein
MDIVDNSQNIPLDTSTKNSVKKRVVLALPGDSFSSKFLLSWTNALAALWSSDKYEIVIAPGTGSYVSFVRMQTLGLDVRRGIAQKPFNGSDYDVWVTIDSDVIFNPEHLITLIDSTDKHPVVSGLYRMSDLTHFAVVKDWDMNYFVENGTFEFLTQEKIDSWKTETELKYMPVNYTGMGFFACRKEVLDKLTYPYFNGELQELVNDKGEILRDMSSEDVNFCKNISKAGYEIVVNTDIRVGHLKPLVI